MNKFIAVLLLLILVGSSAGAQTIYGGNCVVTPVYPTCNNSDGSVHLSDSLNIPIPYPIAFYSLPDTTLIGTGPDHSGLAAGGYLVKIFQPGDNISYGTFFLSNFPALDRNQVVPALMFNIFPDTCTQSKGHIRLGANGSQQLRDTLNLVQWHWSNGQTGLNVSNLEAEKEYYVVGSYGSGCRYTINPSYYLMQWGWSQAPFLKSIRVNQDTLFFSIKNQNTLEIAYINLVKPICQSPEGSVTAYVSNTATATPPYSWNWVNDNITSATLTGAKTGNHLIEVTDAGGCFGSAHYYLEATYPTDFIAQATVTKSDSCLFGQGKISSSVTGGYPPYQYQWDGSSTPGQQNILNNAGYGNHQVNVYDTKGCIAYAGAFVLNQNPINLTAQTGSTGCSGLLGTVTAVASGGVAPYSYHWLGYPEESGNLLDSLLPGYHYFYATDANGCKSNTQNAYVSVANSCYGYVNLDVFRDDNSDCEKQASELAVANNYVLYTVAGQQHYSNIFNSSFMMMLLPGIQDVRLGAKPHFTPSCLTANWQVQNINVTSGQYMQKSVGIAAAATFKNLEMILAPKTGFRPGFNTGFTLRITNPGNLPSDAIDVKLLLPAGVDFLGSVYPHTVVSPGEVTFPVPMLGIGGMYDVNMVLKAQSTVPIGIYLPFETMADTMTNESDLTDNHTDYEFFTVGSFDPNDIRVSPSPMIAPTKTRLEYSIRFQNTGTYYAETVLLRDTLPEELDLSTFRPLFSSHQTSRVQMKGRELTVLYSNIYLQPSIVNEPASHGEFRFAIERYPNLPLGTQIHNAASIYFDFNAPVKTNTAQVEVNEVIAGTKALISFSIYPNPVQEQFSITGADVNEVEILDLSGKRVATLKAEQKNRFSVKGLVNGLYLVRLHTSAGPVTNKLIVNHN